MPKTIRFSELVKKCGRPRVATLWADPVKDADFSRAVKQNRVLTVSQKPTGNKKDAAQIGFKQENNVSYLIFPKGLPTEPEAKVVGINYDLIEQPPVEDPVAASRKARKTKSKGAPSAELVAPEKPKPRPEKRFRVVFKRTAVWESTMEVTAKNKNEARAKGESQVNGQDLPLSEAVLRNEVRAVEEVE